MLPIGILTTTGRMRSTNDESDWTVTECAAWRRSRRGTSRLGEFMAQGETSRVRLKYLGRGFLTLVFMIGTLRSGRRLGSPAVLSTTGHPAILYFKRMLAVNAVCIGLPPPDTAGSGHPSTWRVRPAKPRQVTSRAVAPPLTYRVFEYAPASAPRSRALPGLL